MERIQIPTTPYSDQHISLGGQTYQFIYSYNEFDGRWRIDIYQNQQPVMMNLMIIENQSLIRARYSPPLFDHGDLQCIRFTDDGREATFDNVGIDKPYELIYFTNEELGI